MQNPSLKKILFYLGLVLLLPGLGALGYSLYEGPAAWSTDPHTFWGLPISLFVFWIGLAHAGTLISAIFLALGIRLDRRTAMIAELSTLCSLAVAAVFPLVHLGVVENFYMVAPFADARGAFANVRSPLVWDFCCIAIYGILSLAFFWTQLKANAVPALNKLRRPMAWLLFPLVLWVHTVVSLDFATTFVPQWQGAFFPMYFIVGAVYSGLALVNALLCTEGYRVRLLERLMLVCSWILLVVWLWNFMLKGEFCTSAFVLAGVIPQFLVLDRFRDIRWVRVALYFSVIFGLLAERLYLVMPSLGGSVGDETFALNLVDYGLVSFSAGAFVTLFFGIRHKLSSAVAEEGTYFGEVDGSDMAMNETQGVSLDEGYKVPWTTEEFQMLRMPLLLGLLAVILFVVWNMNLFELNEVGLSFVQNIPLTYPLVALVSFIALYLKFYRQNKEFFVLKSRNKILLALLTIVGALVFGMAYGGGSSTSSQKEIASIPAAENTSADIGSSRLLWNARCASCHGADGQFNQKFVREFYPVPQKLDEARIDSIGVDSLVRVIMNGRNNMNAYSGRLSESQAVGLANYMLLLAKEAK